MLQQLVALTASHHPDLFDQFSQAIAANPQILTEQTPLGAGRREMRSGKLY